MTSLSVVIPTRDRRDQVVDTAGVMLADPAVTELIIADDGSDDGTREALQRAFGRDGRFRCLDAGGKGKAHAEQMALDAATGEVVLFLDDDVRPGFGLAGGHVRHHEQRTGLLRPPRSTSGTTSASVVRGKPIPRRFCTTSGGATSRCAGKTRFASVFSRPTFPAAPATSIAILGSAVSGRDWSASSTDRWRQCTCTNGPWIAWLPTPAGRGQVWSMCTVFTPTSSGRSIPGVWRRRPHGNVRRLSDWG
ncbi:MAG: glycosyltransferase family 2 protein [Actinobacteria bacterium]|nr:glycosyltransferase family 2 protein [Actinomycetota bacterium]